MEEKYIKIDKYTAEIQVTKVESTLVDVKSLLFDKDSLLRTIESNNKENEARNAEIMQKVEKIDFQIAKLAKIGVVHVPIKTATETPIAEEVAE